MLRQQAAFSTSAITVGHGKPACSEEKEVPRKMHKKKCFPSSPPLGEQARRPEATDNLIRAKTGAVAARYNHCSMAQGDSAGGATGVVVKEEEIEEYDGSYACLICTESVRGAEALKCTQCQSNPFHRECVSNALWLRQCPSCGQQTVDVWNGTSAPSAATIATIDLVGLTRDPGCRGEEAMRASSSLSTIQATQVHGNEDARPKRAWLQTELEHCLIAQGETVDTPHRRPYTVARRGLAAQNATAKRPRHGAQRPTAKRPRHDPPVPAASGCLQRGTTARHSLPAQSASAGRRGRATPPAAVAQAARVLLDLCDRVPFAAVKSSKRIWRDFEKKVKKATATTEVMRQLLWFWAQVKPGFALRLWLLSYQSDWTGECEQCACAEKGTALIRQLETRGIDWHAVAAAWARERRCRPEDVAGPLLAAVSLSRWSAVQAGECVGGVERWRCAEPVRLRRWSRPRRMCFVLRLRGEQAPDELRQMPWALTPAPSNLSPRPCAQQAASAAQCEGAAAADAMDAQPGTQASARVPLRGTSPVGSAGNARGSLSGTQTARDAGCWSPPDQGALSCNAYAGRRAPCEANLQENIHRRRGVATVTATPRSTAASPLSVNGARVWRLVLAPPERSARGAQRVSKPVVVRGYFRFHGWPTVGTQSR